MPLDSPNKFPIRTEAAILKEYGAWKVVEAETRRTDWVAKTTGPNKLAATKGEDWREELYGVRVGMAYG